MFDKKQKNICKHYKLINYQRVNFVLYSFNYIYMKFQFKRSLN